MITDAATIQKLALRTDLPRLKAEGFYLFAQLEPDEQTLTEPAKTQLLGRAFAALVAREEQRSERPLPAVLPRVFQRREPSTDWIELEYGCELAEPFERRSRAGNVLGIATHLKGRVRVFKGAFAYFTPDDLNALDTLDASGFTPLE